jgi:FdhD protein
MGVRYCANGSAVGSEFNVVTVETGGRAPTPRPRLGNTTSSCGLCGNDAIDELCDRLSPLSPSPLIPLEVLQRMPDAVEASQGLFDTTGAVHAAAAFTSAGEVLLTREDVGRHNAVDKVVGRLLLDGALPATGLGLFVSGRASFELVQKAWAAGFSTLVAVSAPTALAVHTARRAGLVLAGFVRSDRLNIYSPERLAP